MATSIAFADCPMFLSATTRSSDLWDCLETGGRSARYRLVGDFIIYFSEVVPHFFLDSVADKMEKN